MDIVARHHQYLMDWQGAQFRGSDRTPKNLPSYNPLQLNNENTHKKTVDFTIMLLKQISKSTAETYVLKIVI